MRRACTTSGCSLPKRFEAVARAARALMSCLAASSISGACPVSFSKPLISCFIFRMSGWSGDRLAEAPAYSARRERKRSAESRIRSPVTDMIGVFGLIVASSPSR